MILPQVSLQLDDKSCQVAVLLRIQMCMRDGDIRDDLVVEAAEILVDRTNFICEGQNVLLELEGPVDAKDCISKKERDKDNVTHLQGSSCLLVSAMNSSLMSVNGATVMEVRSG